MVGNELSFEDKQRPKGFLLDNLDVFAWKHADIVGIDPKVRCHHFNLDPKFTSHKKRRALNLERYEALKEEVQKLEDNGFIREVIYLQWI